MKRIVAVVAAYDEEETIEPLTRRLLSAFQGMDGFESELIFVIEGRDRTREIAAEMKSAMAELGVIDGLMLMHYVGNPSMQEHWKNRRKVGKRMGRPPQKRRITPDRAE